METYKYTYQDWSEGKIEPNELLNLKVKKQICPIEFTEIRRQQGDAHKKLLYDALELLKIRFTDIYNSLIHKDEYLKHMINKLQANLEEIREEDPQLVRDAISSKERLQFNAQQISKYLSTDSDERLTYEDLNIIYSSNTSPSYTLKTYYLKWLCWFKEQQALDMTEPTIPLPFFSKRMQAINKVNIAITDKPISYIWKGNFIEVETLYRLLLEGEYLSHSTEADNFRAVFSGKPLESVKPLKWMKAKNLLAYLIDQLNEKEKLFECSNVWSVAKNCFINGKNLAQIRTNYETHNKNMKPTGHDAIDNIINLIR